MTQLRIKEILRSRGISIAQLGEMLGISPQGIAPIINGKRSPNLNTLDRIARTLGVPLVELFGNREDNASRCPYCGNLIKIDKDEHEDADEQHNKDQ